MKSAIAAVGLCLIGWLGPVWGAEAEAEAEPTGAAFCITCHDSEDLTDMSRSTHGFVADKRAPDCITCHGTSKAHAYKPKDVEELPKPELTFGKVVGKLTTLQANQRSQVCQTCHSKDFKRALWSGSQHESADLACDTCHKVHGNRDKVLSSRINQTESCYSCHKDLRNQVNRPSHHPVPEGKMTCADCHNVHGSAGAKLAKRDTMNDTCYTCHAEKRGPFVHQHQPVSDDCANCHNSHGSTIPAMLKVRSPMLCQQCHTPHVAGGVGAVGGQRGVYGLAAPGQTTSLITSVTGGKNVVNLWQGRSCMNCHTQVHGSNNPSTTNATPQRLMR
jgi:DmsE family decaheme c-type cytochrome